MTDKIPERFVWAHQCLHINAKDKILEIGCGAGLFAELIASSLDSGKLIAIDKSRAMMRKAYQRLQPFVNAGAVELITNELAKAKIPDLKFDKVVSYNVNIFWNGSAEEFEYVRKLLKPSGSLFVFYDSPTGNPESTIEKITRKLNEEGFNIAEMTATHFTKGSACCVTGKWS